MSGTNAELWDSVMKEVDTNGDGEISFEEFNNAMMEVIKRQSEFDAQHNV